MGSKRRIAKHIFPIMDAIAKSAGVYTWVEPFVGGANMIECVPPSYRRMGYDLNPRTISALTAVRDFCDYLPDSITELEYARMVGLPADPLTSFVRFVCSFGGKFEAGYAREFRSNERTFIGYGKRNARKQSPKIQKVEFICESYENLDFENCLIYCDPPYQGVSGYKTGDFDHCRFFDWCRAQAKKNIVFVSEYQAPNDFIEVWRGEIKTNFASTRKNATHDAIEKLFIVVDSPVTIE